MPAITDSDLVNTGTSTSSPKTASYTLSAGSNRILIACVAGFAPSVRSVADVTFDGVAPSFTQLEGSNDGGGALIYGIYTWKDSDLPSSSGTYTFSISYDGTANDANVGFIELNSVSDQTTPVKNFASDTGETLSSIEATLAGASGDYGFSILMVSDNVNTSGSDHTKPSALTSLESSPDVINTSLNIAYTTSVASASELYTWAVGSSGGGDSVATAVFSIDAAAGGIVIPVIVKHLQNQGIQ